MTTMNVLPNKPQTFTASEVAAMLKIDRHHVYNAVRLKKLIPAPKEGYSGVRFTEAAVLEWWNNNPPPKTRDRPRRHGIKRPYNLDNDRTQEIMKYGAETSRAELEALGLIDGSE